MQVLRYNLALNSLELDWKSLISGGSPWLQAALKFQPGAPELLGSCTGPSTGTLTRDRLEYFHMFTHFEFRIDFPEVYLLGSFSRYFAHDFSLKPMGHESNLDLEFY